MIKFRLELERLINRHSMENGSDTPDFILAEYLSHCLEAFDMATNRREDWYRNAPENTKAEKLDNNSMELSGWNDSDAES